MSLFAIAVVTFVAVAASEVFATRDGLKVVRVDTLVIAAKVVDIKSIWDWTFVKLV